MSSIMNNSILYGGYRNGFSSQNSSIYGGYSANRMGENAKARAEELGLIKGNEDEDKKQGAVCDCETCRERKYKDGSDENVSFKAATRISPNAAAAAVRSHEGEHVANAYSKAAQNNGKVINASVSIHTAVCPECGRTYVSGGTTHTQIKYYNEDNPYQKSMKSGDRLKYSGMNINAAV